MKINEDYLLLLINNNGNIDTKALEINKNFIIENNLLRHLCENNIDNIEEILFIIRSLKSKIPNRTFNYCLELDREYQSVLVNIDSSIQEIINKREIIYSNQKIAIEEKRDFNLEPYLRQLKKEILNMIELWFKVFDIEIAYNNAKIISNMLVYSHRISGWKYYEYRITENIIQEFITNFGYGRVSYFYLSMKFKNIYITPLSEWIDYRYSKFSEVIRYTKSFKLKKPVFDDIGKIKYFRITIINEDWIKALQFTKDAANLSLKNENEFIDKYIISECEKMIIGLENIYEVDEFELIDENEFYIEDENVNRYRLSIKGYELIDFKTEKIVGALDFISKIIEYNSIIPTEDYISRIIALNRKFIPNVHLAYKNQYEELENALQNYNNFLLKHNELIEREKFYKSERQKLNKEFESVYGDEFIKFQDVLIKSVDCQNFYIHKIRLHTENKNKLNQYINKYNEIINE